MPLPTLEHGGQDGQGGGDRREEVDVEGVAEVLLGDVDQPHAGILRRVVDQQVDRPVRRRHLVERPPQGGGVGHVAGDGPRPRA